MDRHVCRLDRSRASVRRQLPQRKELPSRFTFSREDEDFAEFRTRVSDLIKDCIFIVGSSSVFRQMFMQLQQVDTVTKRACSYSNYTRLLDSYSAAADTRGQDPRPCLDTWECPQRRCSPEGLPCSPHGFGSRPSPPPSHNYCDHALTLSTIPCEVVLG